ncbi:unnamed protein product [Rotaria sp. Silwood2]|nr:unnamed protein product [Rotaria sp. Silwood2]
MFCIILLSSIAILLITIYFYIKWKYFTLRGSAPGLGPEFLFGNLRQLSVIGPNKELIDTYVHACDKLQKKFGDLFQLWMGSNHFYVFCRPEHAAQIYGDRYRFDLAVMRTKTFGLISENFIISLTGSKYKRHAKAILPMLKRNKFLSQIPIIIDCVDQLIHVWKLRYENNEDIPCTSIVNDNQHLMLDTFTLLTFDYDLGNLKYLAKEAKKFNRNKKYQPSDFGQALSTWLDALRRVNMNGLPYIINYYLLKFDRKYQSALKKLQDQAEEIISKCQMEMNENERPTNLVASLVSTLQKDEELERKKSENEQRGITKKELLDEILGLILGGFDTTSTVLSWFIYYMSKNPQVQQKIKDELKQHNITKDTSLDGLNLLDKCEYLDCVIKETLRIQPIGIGSPRTVTEDVTIDGVNIRKGESVLSAFSFMQRDPRYWKLDPKQFIPERFFGIDAPDANHNPYVFAPFGGGHRICIGQELARLELKLIITRFMLFVTFIDGPGNNVVNTWKGDIALDDIQLNHDNCPPIGECTFEQGLCVGWETVIDDDFDWSLARNGSTPSGTPTVGSCLHLWYYLYRAEQGTLLIQQKSEIGRAKIIWTKSNDQDNIWHQKRTTVPPLLDSGTYRTLIIGIISSKPTEDMRMDDVLNIEGECPGSEVCTFVEEDFCSWLNE